MGASATCCSVSRLSRSVGDVSNHGAETDLDTLLLPSTLSLYLGAALRASCTSRCAPRWGACRPVLRSCTSKPPLPRFESACVWRVVVLCLEVPTLSV